MVAKLTRRGLLQTTGAAALGALLAACATPTAIPTSTTGPAQPAGQPATSTAAPPAAATPTAAPAAATPTAAPAAATPTAAPAAAAPSATPAAQAAPQQATHSISLWSMYEPPGDTEWEGHVKAFGQVNPNIKVDLLGKIGYANIVTKLTAAVAGGDPPDVATNWAHVLLGQFEPNGLVMPLDSYMQTSKVDWAKYTPAAKSLITAEGKLWGLAGSHNVYGLLYNKAVFSEVGLDPEKGPMTIDDLDAFSAKIWKVKSDGSIARSGFLPWQPEDWGYNWSYVFGAKVYDPDNRKMLFNAPENVASYEWYYGNIKKYGKKPVLDWVASSTAGFGGRSVPEGPLYTNLIGQWHGGQWYVNFARRYGGDKLKFGTVPLPQKKGQKAKTSILEADVLMLMKGAKSPDDGWAFINWVYNPDTETPFFKVLLGDQGLPSALKYLQNPAQYVSALGQDKDFAVYLDIAATGNAIPRPTPPVLTIMEQERLTARDAILNEVKPVQKAMDDAQANIQKALDAFYAGKK